MTLRRYVVRVVRPAAAAVVWLSVLASYNVVAAQVGHEPAHSPYHDVRGGGVLVFTFGYLGGSLGVAIGGTSPRDTSGYKFGTKFTVAPNVGLRWYPARRLSVRGDVRLVLWKLNYPTQFKQPYPINGTPVLPGNASLTEWTSHPWATIGVGWIF